MSDGGPAFPFSGELVGDPIQRGMSLRDWFAGSAPIMTIEVAARLLRWPADLPMGDEDSDDFQDSKFARWKGLSVAEQVAAEAQWAYCYADAMLRAREEKS